jgi:hypothetical protein
MTTTRWPQPQKPVGPRPGVCLGCGCTDEFACAEGCAWTDELQTMCTECERRARAFLAWWKATRPARRRKAVRP